MKSKFLKSVFPLVAIVFAVAGAFAFNAKPEKSAAVNVYGYIPGSTCEETDVECQTNGGPFYCTDASANQLYNLNAAGTACPALLYRIN